MSDQRSFFARTEFIADGQNDIFHIDFAYLTPAFIEVYVDGALDEGATLPTRNQVKTSTIPPDGSIVQVSRNTDLGRRVHFQNASLLDDTTLNEDSIQMLHIVQEAYDRLTNTMSRGTDYSWDAEGVRMSNLADPVKPTDAMNFRSAQSAIDQAEAEADRSKQEADKSKVQADKSEVEADRSTSEANRSRDEANKSQTQADISTTEADKAYAEAERSLAEAERAINAVSTGLTNINSATTSGVNDINGARDFGVGQVTSTRDNAVSDVNIAKSNAESVISSGITDVENTKTSAVNTVNSTKDDAVVTVNNTKDSAVTEIGTHINKAKDWASKPEDYEVEQGLYSAYHYMQKTKEYLISVSTDTHGNEQHTSDYETISAVDIKVNNAKADAIAHTDTHEGKANPHLITPAKIDAETPVGAQSKADSAESSAIGHTDTHEAKTTGAHGVGTSTIASKAQLDTHAGTGAGVHGVGTTGIASKGDVSSSESSAKSYTDSHESKSNPHSITTGKIGAETPTGAQSKADSAESGAVATAEVYTDGEINALHTVASTGSYTNLINVPTSFNPSAHNHSATEITSGTLSSARLPDTVITTNNTSGYEIRKNGTDGTGIINFKT